MHSWAMFVALGLPLFYFILLIDSSFKDHIHKIISTYIRLINLTIGYTTPNIIHSAQAEEK